MQFEEILWNFWEMPNAQDAIKVAHQALTDFNTEKYILLSNVLALMRRQLDDLEFIIQGRIADCKGNKSMQIQKVIEQVVTLNLLLVYIALTECCLWTLVLHLLKMTLCVVFFKYTNDNDPIFLADFGSNRICGSYCYTTPYNKKFLQTFEKLTFCLQFTIIGLAAAQYFQHQLSACVKASVGRFYKACINVPEVIIKQDQEKSQIAALMQSMATYCYCCSLHFRRYFLNTSIDFLGFVGHICKCSSAIHITRFLNSQQLLRSACLNMCNNIPRKDSICRDSNTKESIRKQLFLRTRKKCSRSSQNAIVPVYVHLTLIHFLMFDQQKLFLILSRRNHCQLFQSSLSAVVCITINKTSFLHFIDLSVLLPCKSDNLIPVKAALIPPIRITMRVDMWRLLVKETLEKQRSEMTIYKFLTFYLSSSEVYHGKVAFDRQPAKDIYCFVVTKRRVDLSKLPRCRLHPDKTGPYFFVPFTVSSSSNILVMQCAVRFDCFLGDARIAPQLTLTANSKNWHDCEFSASMMWNHSSTLNNMASI
ncbi:hypothetical protein EGR_10036 [Echinococcus granulosus]|uniref:Uncharacterized protein n=1 Tax=Echinococcus granulosus TaxID=6210 RepID=W6UNX5_ECHGR|nr:hypothetical protein EGR_10036 [Echinococcus granulosus]EUB55099.1 hypothetical protein EGR_10036 [Echinococcus granulosus]